MAVNDVKPRRGRPAGRQSSQTRANIVRAAREEFGIRGRWGTTMKHVSDHAGLSAKAIYYYFASVDDIYDELLRDTVRLLDECFQHVAAQPTLRSQLRCYVGEMRRIELADRAEMAFLVRGYLDGARGRSQGRDDDPLTTGAARLFGELVRAAVARGELPPDTDVHATAALLGSLVWGIGLHAGVVDAVATLSDRIDDVIVHGLPLTG